MSQASILQNSPAGMLNSTFGVGGIVLTNLLSATNPDTIDEANSLLIQPDGKLVVAGRTDSASPTSSLAILRYNSNGSLDTTFDTDGVATTDVSTVSDGFDVARSVVPQPNSDGAATSGAFIVDSVTNGKLFYNQNGSSSGLGSGAQFAVLSVTLVLLASDFVIQA